MFELKPLSREAIPAALARAERYRFLNEPLEAESICLDILRIDPDNEQALITLLLALTDQIERGSTEAVGQAHDLLGRLPDQYGRAYYRGIISERQAKAELAHDRMGSGQRAYERFREAMHFYEQAEALRPPGNDDALLRWNTCARFLSGHPHLEPVPEERIEHFLE